MEMPSVDGEGFGRVSAELDDAVYRFLTGTDPIPPEKIWRALRSQAAFSQLTLDQVKSSLQRLILTDRVFSIRHYGAR